MCPLKDILGPFIPIHAHFGPLEAHLWPLWPLISPFKPNFVLLKPILGSLGFIYDQRRHFVDFCNLSTGPVRELSKVSKRQNFCVNVHYCSNSSIVKKRKLFVWKKVKKNVISFWFFVKSEEKQNEKRTSSFHIPITNGTLFREKGNNEHKIK